MTTNKYYEIAKKTTIDYIENRISCLVFKETFEKLDEIKIYRDLERNKHKGVSNYISAVTELDDQNILESQTIVNIINLFYCYFTDNYELVYAKDFYKFLKISLNKENETPVKTSFKLAIHDYLDKKISDYCLAFIASEFLNNLKFFETEIKTDKKLFKLLILASKFKPKKLLEDLTPKEQRIKQNINNNLKDYLNKNNF